MWAFHYHDGPFLDGSPSNEFQRERLADCVSDDNPSLVRGAVRMHLQNNRRGLLIPLQHLTEDIRQAHRLQTDSEISARNSALFQKRVGDFVYGRSGNCDRAETREARSRQTNYATARVDYRAAD